MPECQGRVQAGNPGSTYANLSAFCADQWGHRLGWIARFGINCERGPPRIVAVEPKAAVEIQLSTGPGAENQAKLGAKDRVGFVARIDGDSTVDIKDEDILPQPEDSTHFGKP